MADIILRVLNRGSRHGYAECGGVRVVCALGRSGISVRKREGDGATPAGRYRLLRVLYRSDRVRRPFTRLTVGHIKPSDGWCDASWDRNYNRPVSLPYPASAERMWRDDPLYNIVVILDHNHCPRVQNLGSAIFLHIARPGYQATEGCIAFRERDLRRLLARMRRGTRIRSG